MQNLCLETGLQALSAITVIGRPSQLHVDEIEQSQTMWNLQWTRPDRFWSESAALPADYLLALDCGESKMEIVYNDSTSVVSPSFVSVLNAQWGNVDGSRAVTLSAEGSDGMLASPVSLTCPQGDEIVISVTARNRVFNGPVTTIRQRIIAPPSEVVGLRSEEYPGGITLFWKQVHPPLRQFDIICWTAECTPLLLLWLGSILIDGMRGISCVCAAGRYWIRRPDRFDKAV
jgi:hypothetical protein